MGKEAMVNRILSDAKEEADALLAEAIKEAETIERASEEKCEALRKATEEELAERRRVIFEKRAADARLDGAKIWLKEKRKVLSTVYDEAHSRLLELSEEDTLRLIERLLEHYAETGDELLFSKEFPYQSAVELLLVVAKKQLRVSKERQEIGGGIKLLGNVSDKDISYAALIEAASEEEQAELAAELFR